MNFRVRCNAWCLHLRLSYLCRREAVEVLNCLRVDLTLRASFPSFYVVREYEVFRHEVNIRRRLNTVTRHCRYNNYYQNEGRTVTVTRNLLRLLKEDSLQRGFRKRLHELEGLLK